MSIFYEGNFIHIQYVICPLSLRLGSAIFFSVKGQIINIFGFVNHMVPVTSTQFCRRIKKSAIGTSLVAQWLRIRLPMQGSQVRSLVREDPMCRGATKPVHHNYWACTLKPTSHNYRAHVPQLLEPTRLEPVPCIKRSHGNEKPAHRNEE